ncbi:MAG: alpha/beta fold hydrolase [Chitinophagaceae bacterium]
MKKGSFKRRQFIASVATSSIGLMFFNPISSFGNLNQQLDRFQKSDLLFYVDSNGKKKLVTTLAEWEIKRQQILDGMQNAMGQLPGFLNLPGMNIQIIEEIKEKTYTRQTINFTVAENELVPAYLYIPIRKNKRERFPAMLALHETDAIGKKSVDGQGHNTNLAYAKELAQRGYVVIAPDYPSFGDMKEYDFKTDRYQSGMMKSIFDNMRCVDLLQAHDDVDFNRIGVIGHSLGGHNALFTGSFDKRLKVIVSSCGWTLMDYYDAGKAVTEKYGGVLGPWAQDRYMPLLRDKYNLDIKKIPFDLDEVIAAIAPRPFFSNSPLNDSNFSVEGVRKGIAEVSEVYRFLGVNDKLEVRYPESKHDFPPEVRFEAYRFIDKVFQNSFKNKNE